MESYALWKTGSAMKYLIATYRTGLVEDAIRILSNAGCDVVRSSSLRLDELDHIMDQTSLKWGLKPNF